MSKKTEPAVRCCAIYADYDGNAPDTADLLLVADEKLAKQVIEELNKAPGEYGNLAYNQGHEWCKRFDHHEVLVEPGTSICETFDEAMKLATEE